MSVPASFHSPTCELHRPGGEVYVGVATPGTELPGRTRLILDAVRAVGGELREVDAEGPAPDGPAAVDRALAEIQSAELLHHLEHAGEDWRRSGLAADPGQERVVPYLFPHPALLDDAPLRVPASPAARAGRFAYDTMTAIGPGTWEAARAAAAVALEAARAVAAGELEQAYACVRPPGHHATREAFGGSCYLANCAVAANEFRRALGGPVAVLDIDAHHGNGTQSIFLADPEVLTASVHVDPGAGWFPHFVGFASETGTGPGRGANLNRPLAPGAGDEAWLAAVRELAGWAAERGARGIVVALGVDAAAGDPESPLEVSDSGYAEAGRIIGGLGLPTVAVQEGGYDLARIGELVVAFLGGLGAGRD